MRPSENERGAVLVEFAITLILLAIFAAGVVDYGIGVRHAQVMSDVARNATRIASQQWLEQVRSYRNGTGAAPSCTETRETAYKWAKDELADRHFDGGSFEIDRDNDITFPNPVAQFYDFPTSVPLIKVHLRRDASASCLICLNNFLPIFPDIESEAVFPLVTGPDFLPCS